MIYTITLNPSLDVDLLVQDLIPDDSNRVLSRRQYPGGKGVNVSRVVKEMGGSTMALVPLGGHTGDMVAELLRRDRISFETLEIEGETRTNTFVTNQKKSTMTRINERGDTLSDEAIRLLFQKLDLLDLRKVDYLVLGGSLPGQTRKDLYPQLLERLGRKQDPCRVLLDADGDTLMEALDYRPAIIKPNTHEASRALGREIQTREDAIQAAQDFRQRGVETVLLSMGSKGALSVSDDGVYFARAPQVSTVSAVGSGDSFIAGYLSSLVLGLDSGKALQRACAAGAAAALTRGTELCHASDIQRLVPEVVLERIELA